MSEKDARELIKRFVEYKMLWFTSEGFGDKYLLNQAMNILGPEEVERIHQQLKKEWDEE